MKPEEYSFIDKSSWGDGPWQSEADKIQYPDEATGLPCLIVRNSITGILCGYVGVPPAHPFFEKDYYDVDVSVHCGLTYADRCQEQDDHGVCHKADPGEQDDVWWLGFDCAKGNDYAPVMSTLGGRYTPETSALSRGMVYRDVAYVREQIKELARQLQEAAR